MIPGMPPARWSRRSVLGLGLLGATALLAGCSEDPAPDRSGRTDPPEAPASPTGPEVPDVAALLAALDRCRELAGRAETVDHPGGGPAARLAAAAGGFTEQARVLEEVLTAGRVAVPSPSAGPATTTSPPDTATATAAPDDVVATTSPPDDAERSRQAEARARRAERHVEELVALLAEDLTPSALERLAAVTAENLTMLVSLTAHHGAALSLLGGDPDWPGLPGPAGGAAVALLPGFRAAVYAFEVITARTPAGSRELPETTLRRLRRLATGLEELAGPEAPPPPLGYRLDHDTSTDGGRAALAREVLAALPPTLTARAAEHSGDGAAVAGTVRLLAEVTDLGHRWGLPLDPFPGMTLP